MIRLFRNLLGQAAAGREISLRERMVVFDTETTGLNPRRDRLLSIGAVAIERGKILLEDCFYCELDAGHPLSAGNILVHRLTPGRLRDGLDPARGLQQFRNYVGQAPLLAYHAAFDEAMVQRALRGNGLPVFRQPFGDIAQWVLLADPEVGSRPPALEVACSYFRVRQDAAHDAHGDALTSACLAIKLLKSEKLAGLSTMQELEQQLRRQKMMRQWRH